MVWNGGVCKRSSILITNVFPKSKERLGLKNKRFLTIFLSYNRLNEMEKRKGRESVDKFQVLFLRKKEYLVLTVSYYVAFDNPLNYL